MKHWHNLFGSLGKVITISVVAKPYETVLDCLNDIRIAVKDKIKECKSTFNEGRPLVLIGFGHSSLIAAHCALDNSASVTATICLGFPLTAINGFRGVSFYLFVLNINALLMDTPLFIEVFATSFSSWPILTCHFICSLYELFLFLFS